MKGEDMEGHVSSETLKEWRTSMVNVSMMLRKVEASKTCCGNIFCSEISCPLYRPVSEDKGLYGALAVVMNKVEAEAATNAAAGAKGMSTLPRDVLISRDTLSLTSLR